MARQFLLFILIVASFFTGRAQNNIQNEGSGFISAGEAYFNKAIKQQTALYRGKYYSGYNPAILGNAYFNESKNFETGVVTYDGAHYENVPLLYDLYKDLLVIPYYKNNYMLSLISEKVSQFYLAGHRFIRISTEGDSKSPLKTGFYDELYKGKLQVLVKRTKTTDLQINGQNSQEIFKSKNFYYVKQGNTYHPLTGENGFYALFKDNKKELQKYLREKKVKFDRDPEVALALLAAYAEKF